MELRADCAVLETPRLRLRKAKDSDLLPIWQNVWQDARIAKTMLWQPTENLEDAKDRLARTKRFQGMYDAYFVCLKDTDDPIGFAGVKEVEPGVFEDAGICVATALQNQGYGKEILAALMELVFEKRGGRRFIYGCFRENERSAAVCKALGFQYAYSRPETRAWDGYEYISDFYTYDFTEN